MAMAVSMFGREPAGDDPLRTLRQQVLAFGVDVLAASMPIVGAVLVASAVDGGTLSLLTILLAGSVLSYPLLWLARQRLGFGATAAIFVALLCSSAFLIAARGMLTVGSAGVGMLIVLSSTLFFGRRGMAFALAAVLGLHVLAWSLAAAGILPPIAPDMWDPRVPVVWLRDMVLLAVAGGAIAGTELYVLEHLARQIAVQRLLAERETQHRISLEQAQREHAYEREQRERAQHALEQARRLEALGRMSGGIAHDFNNALTVIIGTADVAKLSIESRAQTLAYLDEIVQTARRAGVLTTQLLTLGRDRVTARAAVDIVEFLGPVQDALRRVLPDDVSLVVDPAPRRLIAYTDAAGLERALYNLVLNARDAMPLGGTITVGCDRTVVTDATGEGPLREGSYIRLRVSDTGHGMDPQIVKRIFDPFFTTKTDRGGTGLGLSMVYAFAKDCDGHVDVSSIEGQGTTFTIALPECDAVTTEHVDAALDGPREPRTRAGGRVLVVEDRSDVRSNMVRTLTAHGFKADEAVDGNAALDRLGRGERYAVMCIDGVMPGRATADVIDRAAALDPAMGVLVCSGHLREDLLRRGVQAGRYAFLAKPFTAPQFLSSVDALLQTAAAARMPG